MLADLTPEQEKAFIAAVYAHWDGYVDAYELEFEDDLAEQKAKRYFLAGVKWAREHAEEPTR